MFKTAFVVAFKKKHFCADKFFIIINYVCMNFFLTKDFLKNYVALWLSLIFSEEKFCITAFYGYIFFFVFNGGSKKILLEYSDIKLFFRINEENFMKKKTNWLQLMAVLKSFSLKYHNLENFFSLWDNCCRKT